MFNHLLLLSASYNIIVADKEFEREYLCVYSVRFNFRNLLLTLLRLFCEMATLHNVPHYLSLCLELFSFRCRMLYSWFILFTDLSQIF